MINWVFLIPVVAIAGGCMIGAVAVWSENRRAEREEFHRNETYQKMLDGSAEAAESVRALIEEQERRQVKRDLESKAMGLKMGGSITTVAGLGVAAFLYFLIPDEPIWMAGAIAVLVGPVLVFFGSQVKAG